MLEVFGIWYVLFDLGVLGVNGLVYDWDFEYLVVWFDFDLDEDISLFCVIVKLVGRLFFYI